MVETARERRHDPVAQFSIFVENKVGRLLELLNLFSERNIHVLGLTTVDTSDSSVMRMVVDDPDAARHLIHEHAIAHTETEVLVVEVDGPLNVKKVLSVILQAEINIHYTYSFITRPHGKGAMAFHLEDIELATQALQRNQFCILGQEDISR
ncbi:MAG: acetolactate synthase [Verrucomicrobiota bacterium]